MVNRGSNTPDERWLAWTWPFVRAHLPPSPAAVLEIGCGPLGGFVPALRSDGYNAVGIDPQAPDGSDYHRTEFQHHDMTHPVDAIVACTSLHHVADLHDVVDRIAAAVRPTGVVIVVEWARERFDEKTARWCFARLAAADGDPGWMCRHRADWAASGQSWARTARRGRGTSGYTPVGTSCAHCRHDLTPCSSPRGRTSFPTLTASRRRTNNSPSTPDRSNRTASGGSADRRS
jgi:SAM-dependent methyltransferase